MLILDLTEDAGLFEDVSLVTGSVSNNIYRIPSFAYCSNDADFDGHLTVDGLTYNWGVFNAVSDVPFEQVSDICPEEASLTTTTNIWFEDTDGDGFGNPLVSTRNCNTVAPEGYVATKSFTLGAVLADGVVTVARDPVLSGRVKQLAITSANSQIQIEASLSTDDIIFIQDETTPLQVSRNDADAITKYCLRVKGNSASLVEQYMLIIPATGEKEGIIQSTVIIDSDPLTVQEISLDNDGDIVEGATLTQVEGAEPCDFIQE